MDSFNYVNINNPNARQVLLKSKTTHNLIDVFRYLHPEARRYTWCRRNPIKQARLDYFIVSGPLIDLIQNCDITAGYRSDHSILKIQLQISKFEIGKGLWKLNCNLLKNIEYIELINKTINEVKLRYALPVYNINYLETVSDLDIKFTIDEDILLELIMYKIRYKTVKFASKIKKEQAKQEKDLIKKLMILKLMMKICNLTKLLMISKNNY